MLRLGEHPTLKRLTLVNVGIVLAGAIGGTVLTRQFDDWPTWALVLTFFCLGAVMIAMANYTILRNTFRPLTELSRSMATIHKGERDWSLEVEHAEPSLRDVARAATEMLDRLDVESRTYSEKIFESIENERRRIGRELHDETSQSLAAALLNLDLAEKGLGETAPVVRDRIAAAKDLVRHGLSQTKLLIHDLRPSMLDDFGLVPALRWFEKTHLGDFGLEIETDLPSDNLRLPSKVETALYRIAQESLGNVARHSGATKARLSLDITPEFVSMVVSDDGRGFDPDDVILDKDGRYGVGLLSIKERAELLRGTAHITSAPGKGTQVRVGIPLPSEDPERVEGQ